MVVTQSTSLSTGYESSPKMHHPFPKMGSFVLQRKVDRQNSKRNASGDPSTKIRFNANHTGASGKTNNSIPIITSFAMKEEGASPGMASNGTNSYNQMLSPKDINELILHLRAPEFSSIRYSAYRAALKLHSLQKGLCFDIVRLGTIVGVFCQHGLGQPLGPVYSRGATPNLTNVYTRKNLNNHDDILIGKQKAADILSGIFFSAGKGRAYYQPTLDVLACAESSLALVMSIYGQAQENIEYRCISVKALKFFCVMLCEGRLVDKFSYLYQEFSLLKAKTMKFMTRKNLSFLLSSFCKLSDFLGEAQNFGIYLVDAAVSQCFGNEKFDIEQNDNIGIPEDVFMAWILREPQVIVWVATFYRLVSAQNIHHGMACTGCKNPNIKGLRYQCMRCLNHDLCQNCFFHGIATNYHKLWHPMQEYCTRGTRKDATKALFKVLTNQISIKKRRQDKQNRRRAKQLYAKPPEALKELQPKMNTNKLARHQRYLLHDPNLERTNLRSEKSNLGKDELDNFKKPYTAANGKSVECHVPKPERHQFHNDSNISTMIVRQDGDEIIATDHQISNENMRKEENVGISSVPNIKTTESSEHQAKLFNSIVVHLEEQNIEIMKKLKEIQESNAESITHNSETGEDKESLAMDQQHPLESCQSMQHQLQRLKGLVDNIFGENVGQEKIKGDMLIKSLNQPNSISQNGHPSHDLCHTPPHNYNNNPLNKINDSTHFVKEQIQSTPLCHANPGRIGLNGNVKTKSLHHGLSNIQNEFSPIVMGRKETNSAARLWELETLRESSASRSVARNNNISTYSNLISPESLAVDDILSDHHSASPRETGSNTIDTFPFSRMSLHELTSLLVKTGKIPTSFDHEYPSGNEGSSPYNVSKVLDPKYMQGINNDNQEGTKTEILEELESLMLRLEDVFDAYHFSEAKDTTETKDKMKRMNSVHLQQIQKEQDPLIIGQIVSEIVDQIHSFNYECIGNVKMNSQQSSSPSIARSDGDGLSSPEPPIMSTLSTN